MNTTGTKIKQTFLDIARKKLNGYFAIIGIVSIFVPRKITEITDNSRSENVFYYVIVWYMSEN